MSIRLSLISVLACLTLLAGCERPPMESVQTGFRGTGMVQVYNPRTLEANAQWHEAPPPSPWLATTARALRRSTKTSRCSAT